MLNEEQLHQLQAVALALREHADRFTEAFNTRLHVKNPELLALFDRGIVPTRHLRKHLLTAQAFAQNVDNPEVVRDIVQHIVSKEKHQAISYEQTQLFITHLLASMREVLGDAFTPEIYLTWKSAILQVLKHMHQRNLVPYTCEDDADKLFWTPVHVARRHKMAEHMYGFSLMREDGKNFLPYQAAQYVWVRWPNRPELAPRPFTLSRACVASPLSYEIVAENTESADTLAAQLCMHAREGEVLEISQPVGDFIIDANGTSPLIFIAKDLGTIPVCAMLDVLAMENPLRRITVLIEVENSQRFALAQEIRHIIGNLPNAKLGVSFVKPLHRDCVGKDYNFVGHMNLTQMKQFSFHGDARFFVAGPDNFLFTKFNRLLSFGIDRKMMHFETMGSHEHK